jgi:hypothetical protein
MYEWRLARAEARAPHAGVVSSISRSHSPCQEGAVGTDPSMSDIPYIDVKTRMTKDKSTHACTLGIQTGSGQYTQHT